MQLEHVALTDEPSFGKVPGTTRAVTGQDYFAPAWAVYVLEAEPCNDAAREQFMERVKEEPDLSEAIDLLIRTLPMKHEEGTPAASTALRRKIADYILELWEP